MTLFHYCCRHSARAITRRGFLRPHGRDFFGVGLVWLTDQATPNRDGLGLTSHLQPCDRLAYRYVVETAEAEPWLSSAVRDRLSASVGFEGFEEGRQPETWWIASRAVWAIQDRTYGAEGRAWR